MKVRLLDLKKVVDKMVSQANGSNYSSDPDGNVEVEIKFSDKTDNPIDADVMMLSASAHPVRYDGRKEYIELTAQVFSVSENQQPTIRRSELIMGAPEDEEKAT